MASSIGANNFIGVWGAVQKPHQALLDIGQPFADGACLQKLGKRAPISELRGVVDLANVATAYAVGQGYDAMVGTVVSVTHFNVTTPNVLILSVRWEVEGGDNGVGVGGLNNGPVLLRSLWQVQYLGVS